MTNPKDHESYIEHLLERLTPENLSHIDFDRLRRWLGEVRRDLAAAGALADDLQILRDDYRHRIAGMAKAIAVVNRRRNSSRETLDFIDTLQNKTAAELTECYRETVSRFRDHFPVSFGLLSNTAERPRQTSINDYK